MTASSTAASSTAASPTAARPTVVECKADDPGMLKAIDDVSHETIDRMERYRLLLTDWQCRINLVGPRSLSRFWSHHMADAVLLRKHAPDARSWIDIGSGAGLPGLGLAMLLAEDGAPARIDSVESDSRKCAFQRAALLVTGLRDTSVDVAIHNGRVENFRPTSRDAILTARALAPLHRLLGLVSTIEPLPERLLLLKGVNHQKELDDARKSYRFDVTIHAHPLHEGSVLLDLIDVRPL